MVAADEALFGKLRRLARCSSLREAASHGPTLASPLNQTLGRPFELDLAESFAPPDRGSHPTGGRLGYLLPSAQGKRMNGFIIVGIIINGALVVLREYPGGSAALMGWFVGISILGAMMIVAGKRKLGANMVIVGCVLFVPVGFIGIIGGVKVLNQLNEAKFKRTKVQFRYNGDLWPIVEKWATENGYRQKDSGGTKRTFQKGSFMLKIKNGKPQKTIEAWIKAGVIATSLGMPAEMGIESGGFTGAARRSIARKSVNKLLGQLG